MIVSISLHNLPEGIAIASGASRPGEGSALMIALTIAAHDIPEGICTCAPYYYATGKRLRAFMLSCLTSVPTLIGFFGGRLFMRFLTPFSVGIVSACTAGLMIYICCRELIPAAEKGNGFITGASFSAGVIFVLILGNTVK